MSEKPYHHGNLKKELIERGLEFIDQHGVENLSMRKLADLCGVSSAAPYAHFRNKEDYLIEVQQYITDQFVETLQETVKRTRDQKKILLNLGKKYVIFFYENPLYYHFLFFYGKIDLVNYQPYQLFTGISSEFFTAMGVEKKNIRPVTLALWSMVHGLAGLSTMGGVLDSKKIEKDIESVLQSVKF